MQITRLQTVHLQPRWLGVRVHTDAGLTGLGGWVNVTTTGDYITEAARLAAELKFTAFKRTVTDAMRPLESRTQCEAAAENFRARRCLSFAS